MMTEPQIVAGIYRRVDEGALSFFGDVVDLVLSYLTQ